ncbi:restriction endonuclease subunit S [Sporolactobacillus vineae]|uniref:restriction endonuclease subunit S n=1 Tax=Sporolactobacillus vineae TaxID=444463 RepID=UPI00028A2999|nr:restriction endonuclease subunit S [Sporolactobacillus vineae]
MTEQTNLVPKRRFKEFQNTSAWEQRKLGELIKLTSGGTPSKSNPKFWGGNIVWLSSQEIKQRYVSQGTYMITQKAVEETATKLVEKDTPLIVYRSGILAHTFPISRPTKTVAINQDIKALTFDRAQLNTQFVVSQLESKEQFILHKIVKTGTTVQSVNIPDLIRMHFFTPTMGEQTKIATFFDHLDNAITLHQRKLEKLKALKSAYLSEMFPAEGEREPKRRFAGFTGAWEQRKLGEVSKSFEYGLNISATKYDGTNKYIRITDIDDETREFKTDSLTSPDIDLSKSNNYKLQEGDVLFARTGASVGKTYRYKKSDGIVYYAGFLIRARIKPEFDSEFVFQNTLTNKYNNFIKITSQRSGQPGVNAQEYADYKIMVPELVEQKKIGAFFSSLDQTIALHQHKLEKLQNMKNAYLNEMFV